MIADNLDGPLSMRPRNLREFWKENTNLKVDNLERDFRWKESRRTNFDKWMKQF